MTSCRRSAAWVAIALSLVAAGRCRAEPADLVADRHVARGERLFGEGDYAGAADELRAAYATKPRPLILYSLGQAYRLAGRCADAIGAYESFLRTHPPASQADAARGNIARCRSSEPPAAPAPPSPNTLVTPAPTPPSPAPTVAPAPAVVATTVPAPIAPRPPVYKRWWLWTAIGGVAVVTGLGLGLGLGLRPRSASFSPTLPLVGPGAP